MKVKNIIELWMNLSRVYEIAKLGGLSIKIVYQTEYKEAKDDYIEIKMFYNDVSFSADGDLICEITKPYEYKPKVKNETISDINKRLESARKIARPTEYQSDSCSALLKTATERLNFSLTDVSKVNEIAGVIAQLGDSALIRVEHIAEAVQYRAFMNGEIAVVAENSVLNFGPAIQISLTDIESDHINSAIAYLEKLKK